MAVSNKTVLITGGASGIGAATARLLAEEGARLIVADVAEAAGRALVGELGAGHRFVPLDVSRQENWIAAIACIAPEGRLDLAIFNAGVLTRPTGTPSLNDPIPWITPQSMERLIGVNVYGVLWGVLACLPAVEAAGGTMIIMSSAGGLQPVAFDPTYAMTKFGMVGLGLSLAPTLESRGVRLVTVCPHSVDTPMQPPDLDAQKKREGYSSPPSHMARSILDVYGRARPGEVWLSRPDGMPMLVPTPGVFKAKMG